MNFVEISQKEATLHADEYNKDVYQCGFLNGVMITETEAIDAFERVFDKFLGKQTDAYWIKLKYQMADEIRKDLGKQ